MRTLDHLRTPQMPDEIVEVRTVAEWLGREPEHQRPKAIDLFCGAGGASMGLHRAGFDVTGVDIKPQPRYPFRFIQADALHPPVDLSAFDFIWASPPCQDFCAYQRTGMVRPRGNLIPETRALLDASGVTYCIENVPGAPLRHPVTLCGSAFGLDVRRHRIFECNFLLLAPGCNHARWSRRFKSSTGRRNKRFTIEIGAWDEPLTLQQDAMGGVDWMRLTELSEAIPPAYGAFIGRAALRHLGFETRHDRRENVCDGDQTTGQAGRGGSLSPASVPVDMSNGPRHHAQENGERGCEETYRRLARK